LDRSEKENRGKPEGNHLTWTGSVYDGGFRGERFSDTYDADFRYEVISS
jgi:hypothetical protein